MLHGTESRLCPRDNGLTPIDESVPSPEPPIFIGGPGIPGLTSCLTADKGSDQDVIRLVIIPLQDDYGLTGRLWPTVPNEPRWPEPTRPLRPDYVVTRIGGDAVSLAHKPTEVVLVDEKALTPGHLREDLGE